MSNDRPPVPPLYPQVDVAPTAGRPHAVSAEPRSDVEQTRLLRDLLAAQDRQNELLEELVAQMGASQKQRHLELNQWRAANPELATGCRQAAETLSRVQSEFLLRLVDEVRDNGEHLADGEFMLSEFVDRFGPRLAHLNGIIQVLAQLSNS